MVIALDCAIVVRIVMEPVYVNLAQNFTTTGSTRGTRT